MPVQIKTQVKKNLTIVRTIGGLKPAPKPLSLAQLRDMSKSKRVNGMQRTRSIVADHRSTFNTMTPRPIRIDIYDRYGVLRISRHFASFKNAKRRMIDIAIDNCCKGDIIEVIHKQLGLVCKGKFGTSLEIKFNIPRRMIGLVDA